MKATFYSLGKRLAQVWLTAGLPLFSLTAAAVAGAATDARYVAYVQAEYADAQNRFRIEADNPTNAESLACACYDAADLATNEDERADLARQGIAACRQSIVLNPKYGPTHYYLAMDMGQLAKTEFLGALALVREMEREFKVAAALDPSFDYAGPERNLGLLYLEAPSIGSIGSRRKAREFLEKADKLAPDYPENILNLAEAYLKWEQAEKASGELLALKACWDKARTRFAGDAWVQSWDDWTSRRTAAEKTLEKIMVNKAAK
jgi:tetratricopeptide (TPR) repeat protein